MADVIGRGVIEVSADASKLKSGIDDAKRSIKGLGKDVSGSMQEATGKASRSIDNYIKKLQTAAATNGMSSRESELYTLSLKGASKAQLEAADSALKMTESYERGARVGQLIRTGFIAIASAALAAGTAVTASIAAQADALDKFNDIKDATGASIENISALDRVARETGGSIESVESILVKFNATLKEAKPGDDADRLFKSLNLNIKELKGLDPAEALRRTAVAFAGFESDGNKARAMQELFGKSVKEAAPFLNDLAEKTALVGTTSTQTAAQAEIFNKQLFDLKANATDAARSIVSDLLPAMTTFLQNFKEIRAQGNFGLLVKDAAKDVFGFGQLSSDASADIKNLMRTRDRLQKDLEFSTRKGIGTRDIESDLADNARLLAVSRARERNTINAQFAGQDFGDAVSRRNRTPTIADFSKPPKSGKKDTTAAQEAKAQLAFDLEEIKKEQAALANTLGNSEKLISAQRSANLISEGDYYAKKRELLQADIAAQESAAQKEIARLQQENLSGKEKIDNDRKIVAAQAQLAKLRENATANLQVLAIQEKDSLDSIARAYVDARQAAQSYLDVTERARQLELDSMGMGTRSRDFGAAISQIAEKYEQQRQDLQRDNRNGKFAGRPEDFQRELALLNEFQAKSIASYTDYYAKLTEKQGSFALGAAEALKNYYDESQNVFKQTEDAVSSAFKGMEDAIIEFAKTGKVSVKSLVDSILSDIARIVIKQQITGPLAGLLSGALGGGGGGYSAADQAGLDGLIAGLLSGGRAIGGPVSAGGMYRVNEGGPEMLTAGGKDYLLMGSQGGSVRPNAAGGTLLTVIQNFTVGDVASMAQVKQAVAGSERRIAAGYGRSRSYGGAAT